jgi:hypothetical protein
MPYDPALPALIRSYGAPFRNPIPWLGSGFGAPTHPRQRAKRTHEPVRAWRGIGRLRRLADDSRRAL